MQLEEIYSHFLAVIRKSKGNPQNGMLTRVEFQPICQSLQATGLDTIESLFRFWDKNHDGAIGFGELVETLHLLNKGSELEQWRALFESYDIDGNGTISFNEFLMMFQAFFPKAHSEEVKESAKKAFVSMDLDHDHKLTFTEFCEVNSETNFNLNNSFNAAISHYFGLPMKGSNFDQPSLTRQPTTPDQ
eukprot:gb/GEZN01008218.1/.p1 GENE.gb/GEZN01008218.1/~~gb/GEZN01008218.1/.p1  ORF type:complete len:189 (-),score=20.24 gb/GEZN01008218.1/:106-672(-)